MAEAATKEPTLAGQIWSDNDYLLVFKTKPMTRVLEIALCTIPMDLKKVERLLLKHKDAMELNIKTTDDETERSYIECVLDGVLTSLERIDSVNGTS
jgi:hypothetical protein